MKKLKGKLTISKVNGWENQFINITIVILMELI